MSFIRSGQKRNFALPAAGSWAGKATDSIGDDVFLLGQWYDTVCTHFGWKQINSNLIGNGSVEVDLTDWVGESLPNGAAMTRDSARASDGTWSVKMAGPTSGAAAQTYYSNFAGGAVGSIPTTISGGIVNAAFTGLTGAGYISTTIASAGGGATTQGTYAAAVGNGVVGTYGVLLSVSILTGGAGYTNPPTFSITDPFSSGTGASFTAVLSGGAITSVTVNSGGSGYAAGTTLLARGGGATVNPVLTPTVVNGVITSVTVVSGGASITTQPTFCADCTGSGCALNATVSGGAVTAVAVSNGGSGSLYPGPTVVYQGSTGGSGVQLAAYVDASGLIKGGFIVAGGLGYTAAGTGIVARMAPQTRAYNQLKIAVGTSWTLNMKIWTGGPSGSPIGPPIANIFVQANSVDATTGVITTVGSASGSGALSTWVPLSASFTVPANSAGMYYHVGATTTALNQVFWVDAVQMCKGLNVSPPVYTDFTQRGAISGCTIQDVAVFTNNGLPANRTPLAPSIQGGGVILGSGTIGDGSAAGGIASLQSTVGTRITRHTTMNILFIECGINDLANMTSANGANAATINGLTTALGVIFTDIAAMTSPPVVVVLGLLNFGTGAWNSAVPTGYPNYYQAADEVDRQLRVYCTANNALYVPIRQRMHESFVSANGPHPVVPIGTNFVASCVIDALEQGMVM